jgi:hypothetical protein
MVPVSEQVPQLLRDKQAGHNLPHHHTLLLKSFKNFVNKRNGGLVRGSKPSWQCCDLSSILATSHFLKTTLGLSEMICIIFDESKFLTISSAD